VLLNVKQYAADYGRNMSVQYRVPELVMSAVFSCYELVSLEHSGMYNFTVDHIMCVPYSNDCYCCYCYTYYF